MRIVVAGPRAEIYVNDMEKPLLFVPEQKREIQEGKLGLSAFFAPAHFSNFRFASGETPPLSGRADPVETPAGAVTAWAVSDAFDEASLASAELLGEEHTTRSWSALSTEASALANLARVQRRTREKNTVFARVRIRSDEEQQARLRFGFSDRMRLYLNGRLLYRGDNSYRSRDYRYLGTIGFFDEVALPLRGGDNELWLAVSEDFGGWGVQATLEASKPHSVSAPVFD